MPFVLFMSYVCHALRLFISALRSPAKKGLTSWLSFVMLNKLCRFPMFYPGSGVVLDYIDS